VRDLKNKSRAHILTFGFGLRADLRSTDVVITNFPPGTNFKINHDGNIVPVWLESFSARTYICGLAPWPSQVLGLNLSRFRSAERVQGLPGKMRIIGA